MSRSENVAVSKENHEIIKNNRYPMQGTDILFSHTLDEQQQVEVYTPLRVEELLMQQDKIKENALRPAACRFVVANVDSFYASSDLVMNFANSFHPGGGYIRGASAQEEALCRQSTLYASIASKKANEMYEYNLRVMRPFDSDYMLLSPVVEVFRDEDLSFLQKPYTTAVLTIPAPNLNQMARGQAIEKVDAVMKQRIRQYLLCAMANGYRKLTLGAWGCGAFGHDAKRVAGYFYEILIGENWQQYFETILFAVLDKEDYPYNYLSFAETFGQLAHCFNPRSENAEKPFYPSRLPFALWNLSLKDKKTNPIWLITSRGLPAAAVTGTEAGKKWIAFFIPEMDTDRMFHLKKAGSTRHLTLAGAPDGRWLWENEKAEPVMDVSLVQSYVDLLTDEKLLKFTGDMEEVSLTAFTEEEGKKVLCLMTCLEDQGQILAESPVTFLE